MNAKKINRSVKLSDVFYHELKDIAELRHRSISAQIEYWACLGRAVEQKLTNAEIEDLLIEGKNLNYKKC